MIFECVILNPYEPDECNGDVLTASAVLKIGESITPDLTIDFNHNKDPLDDVRLLETNIMTMSDLWGDKIARKGALTGIIESDNEQVNEYIREGKIRGVSLHTRFNPDESSVCACELEESPSDKTFNNTENKECLNPLFLSIIGGDKIPCNGFGIKIIEDDDMKVRSKLDKQEPVDIEKAGCAVDDEIKKAELTEERVAEIVANAVSEGLQPLLEAISEINTEKAEDDEETTEDVEVEEFETTEDTKDKLDIEKSKPALKRDIFGLEIVKIE